MTVVQLNPYLHAQPTATTAISDRVEITMWASATGRIRGR